MVLADSCLLNFIVNMKHEFRMPQPLGGLRWLINWEFC